MTRTVCLFIGSSKRWTCHTPGYHWLYGIVGTNFLLSPMEYPLLSRYFCVPFPHESIDSARVRDLQATTLLITPQVFYPCWGAFILSVFRGAALLWCILRCQPWRGHCHRLLVQVGAKRYLLVQMDTNRVHQNQIQCLISSCFCRMFCSQIAENPLKQGVFCSLRLSQR